MPADSEMVAAFTYAWGRTSDLMHTFAIFLAHKFPDRDGIVFEIPVKTDGPNRISEERKDEIQKKAMELFVLCLNAKEVPKGMSTLQ